jgi:hypothetical protein
MRGRRADAELSRAMQDAALAIVMARACRRRRFRNGALAGADDPGRSARQGGGMRRAGEDRKKRLQDERIGSDDGNRRPAPATSSQRSEHGKVLVGSSFGTVNGRHSKVAETKKNRPSSRSIDLCASWIQVRPSPVECAMFNWFDLMRQSQGGAGFDNMARQFGLRPEQIQLAMAAMLPALAMGFQRSAMNPMATMQLFQLMSGGQYPSFFESATRAFSAQGRRDGEAVLDRLFGSDEVTRQVARQAAQFSGVGTEVLNQLLPLTAAILVGGLFKAMVSQTAMLGSMAEAWQNAAARQTGYSDPGQAWVDLWSHWMQAMTQGTSSSEPAPSPSPSPSLDSVMATVFGPPSKPANDSDASKAQDEPAASWGEIMEKGQEMQRRHLESLQAIFDSTWGRGAGSA